MRKTIAGTLLALAGTLPAVAQTQLTDIATGAAYVLTMQPDGTATVVGVDGASDTYTLHADLCVAEHPIYGLVSWKAADGGWQIAIDGAVLVSFEGDPPPVAINCAQ